MKDPYTVIMSRHITEKTTVLEQLKNNESNLSVARFKRPKYVFMVDPLANKTEIAEAVEAIYKDEKIKVVDVNTLRTKRKPKRRGRGRRGATSAGKKAIVTLDEGDSIDNV
ncbi:MAG: 50S ribosomal protein L23 [Chlamydiae bacterium]|nr:50S ribosomal protein L23 [Chlamydiota bacterium]